MSTDKQIIKRSKREISRAAAKKCVDRLFDRMESEHVVCTANYTMRFVGGSLQNSSIKLEYLDGLPVGK